MRIIRKLGLAAAALACLMMAAPQVAYATSPDRSNADSRGATAKDVALGPGGTLRGQVVDNQGVAQVDSKVAVVSMKDSRLVSMVQTDKNGEFAVSDLSGGVYQIGTEQGSGVYRLWAGSAPPAAEQAAMVVADGQVVRGQGGGSWLSFFANPWVLAGLVAAAIAIPLALDDDDAS